MNKAIKKSSTMEELTLSEMETLKSQGFYPNAHEKNPLKIYDSSRVNNSDIVP